MRSLQSFCIRGLQLMSSILLRFQQVFCLSWHLDWKKRLSREITRLLLDNCRWRMGSWDKWTSINPLSIHKYAFVEIQKSIWKCANMALKLHTLFTISAFWEGGSFSYEDIVWAWHVNYASRGWPMYSYAFGSASVCITCNLCFVVIPGTMNNNDEEANP